MQGFFSVPLGKGSGTLFAQERGHWSASLTRSPPLSRVPLPASLPPLLRSPPRSEPLSAPRSPPLLPLSRSPRPRSPCLLRFLELLRERRARLERERPRCWRPPEGGTTGCALPDPFTTGGLRRCPNRLLRSDRTSANSKSTSSHLKACLVTSRVISSQTCRSASLSSAKVGLRRPDSAL